MAESATTSATPAQPEPGAQAVVEAGNYEVIRARLLDHGRELKKRAEALNDKRKKVFGGQEIQLLATERVRTENNCVPCDMVEVRGLLLLGYHVFIGLKSETKIGDVFALHKFDPLPDGGYDCSHVGLEQKGGFLQDPEFVKAFSNLYKYARDARLLSLSESETRLFAVFQSGGSHLDTKVFRWRYEADGRIVYMDDRGEREYAFPAQYDFEWRQTVADDQVEGRYVNVCDKVFVSTVGGKLAICVEDNTTTGREVLVEPVDDHNQILSDAEFHYAEVGQLVLLKVKPFREEAYRHYAVNVRTQQCKRIDAIGLSCVELPEDHGIIFPGGYYLQSGEHKVFDADVAELELQKKIAAPNGEDALYVYFRRRDGYYVLLPYNLIRKEIATPIACHGYSLFEDGRLLVFRSHSDEPTRVHPMQVWRTPFTSAEFAATAPTDGSFLAKVGNADLVRGVSDSFSLCRLIENAEPSRQAYEDMVGAAQRSIDAYYWLSHEEAGDLKTAVDEVRRTAELIIDEFEKVVALRRRAAEELKAAEERLAVLVRDTRTEHWKKVDPYLEALTKLRGLRGHLITLREIRYIDLAALGELEKKSIERFDQVSRDCVTFLLREEALGPLGKDLDAILEKVATVQKVADVVPLKEKVDTTASGLDLLSEVIANLQVDDATKRTRILESIGVVFGHLNRVRATVDARRKELLTAEGKAEFAAQFQLLGQSVSSALGMCAASDRDGPEKCDEQLSRLLVQLEELEGRFSEFDEFLGDLAQKREEIADAFAAKKQTLLDERQKRIQNIAQAIDRILEGVGRRSRGFAAEDELNAYFASDAMVMKARQLAEQLVALGDSVKADAYNAKLKSARQSALRGLRDKLDLFEDGDNVIKLGRHRFNVNTQPLEVTMVPQGGGMALHLTGTDFYEAVADEAFDATRAFWSQTLVSETEEVYRGEYLAVSILFDAEAAKNGLSLTALRDAARQGALAELVRRYAQDRYDEGYERGLHDHDGALLLEKLLPVYDGAGLLRYAPGPRALAALFWGWHDDAAARRRWQQQAKSLGRLERALGYSEARAALGREIATALGAFLNARGLADLAVQSELDVAGRYLCEELAAERPRFVTSADAIALRASLDESLDRQGARAALEEDLRALEGDLRERFAVCRAWVDGFVGASPEHAAKKHLALETAVLLCDRAATAGGIDREPSSAITTIEVTGLLGQHARVESRTMKLRIDELLARLGDFIGRRVPAYREYRKLRHELLEREKRRLRLDELMPKVMTAFVRNKLINDVYLPLVGDNLAKQIGAAGDAKRTDLMGLLLLVSPPGYGKTTLMEYVASRLGLVFVKVNGPALGHGVVSIDPAEAPNATSRQEVEKINLALEMGNNVMLYLDDIQHTNPELLQKFISLCDAQRRIEGVWRGRTRTYDMRGRKFCVCMAGNPYTESGETFRIPDMLANRADTYNLGDILAGKEEAFALSYVENALTSNAVLQPLATRDQADVYKLIKMSQGEEIPMSELSYGYSGVELEEVKAIFRHLSRVQRVLLKVNLMYIESAAQDEKFRTEPTFKLQGSYRNMNRMAEKIVPAMNEGEVEHIITDHYLGESQTLTTGAEHNLLKLAEMRGVATDVEKKRWEEIKREFVRHKRMGGGEDDPVTRVTGTLSGLGAELEKIRDAVGAVASSGVSDRLDVLGGELGRIQATLHAGANTGLSERMAGLGETLVNVQQTLAAGTHATKSEIGERLDALSHTLAQAMAKMQQALAARQDGGRHADGQALQQLGTALESLGRQKLEVQVQAPNGIEDLLQQQVLLVERTLVPIVKTATKNMKDGQELARQLAEVLDLLRQIDSRMRSGQPHALPR